MVNKNHDACCVRTAAKLAAIILLATPLVSLADVVTDYATSEQNTSAFRSGSVSDTTASDDVYEALTELQSGGQPSRRYSYISNDWVIPLSVVATTSTFYVEAYHTANNEGDDFVFSYSTDGNTFTPMLTVTKTSDDNTAQSFALPGGLSGNVIIRVTDTDQTPGNSATDTVYIDQMYIESDGTSGGGGGGGLSEFSGSYRTATMTKSLAFNGYEPNDGGTHPVFVFVTGTKLSSWSGDDQLITQEMAQKGFVAVSVDYATRMKYPTSCSQMMDTVEGVFDSADAGSAINAIAARPTADVSKGLVVMGFSQGANIASIAKNFDADVAAVFLIGNGYVQWGATCYDDASTVITADRTRSVAGQSDAAYVFSGGPGGDVDQNRMVQEVTTGVSCGPTATNCTFPDGSGWYLVPASETADGREDHCFIYQSGCGGLPMDTEFLGGSHFWSLGPALDWLASFTQP